MAAEIAIIVIANAVLFAISRLIHKRQERARILRTLQESALEWQEAGWIPLTFHWEGRTAVLTTRNGDRIERIEIS